MSKKIGGFLVLLCMMFQSSFGMHKAIVVGSKILAGATTIGLGFAIAQRNKDDSEKFYDSVTMPSPLVKKLYTEEMRRLPLVGPIPPFVVTDEAIDYSRAGWGAYKDKCIVIHSELNDVLEEIILHADGIAPEHQQQYQDIIRTQKILIRCAAQHYMANDDARFFRFSLLSPVIIQAVSSLMMHPIRYVFSIKPSKTVLSTVMRSSASIVGIIPKVLLNIFMLKCFFQVQHIQALRFSCQQAESKDDLLALYDVSLTDVETKEITQHLAEWEVKN